MLYLLANWCDSFSPLRLFGYVSFRAFGALVTSFLIVMLLAPRILKILKRHYNVSAGRYDGLFEEKYIDRSKEKTPSMGGFLIVGSIIISSVLWCELINPIALVSIYFVFFLMMIGFLDDYLKLKMARVNTKCEIETRMRVEADPAHKMEIEAAAKAAKEKRGRGGLPAMQKMLLQFLVTGSVFLFLDTLPGTKDYLQQLWLPFVSPYIWMSPWVLVISTVSVVFFSNAVNLTDGKDGLASGVTIFCTFAFIIIAYLTGHLVYSKYLGLPYIAGCAETVVFGAAMIGSCTGFLWFNCYPASMFMGDTGSLPLGGAIGLIAVLVRQEGLLLIAGGVFVMEGLSVLMQVCSYKLFKKRIFLCTPIHHHFERKGWPETKIIVRFWILSGICALLALATLKIRFFVDWDNLLK